MAWHSFDAHASHPQTPAFIPVDRPRGNFVCRDAQARVAAARHIGKTDKVIDRH
jgi:hypothetical protein